MERYNGTVLLLILLMLNTGFSQEKIGYGSKDAIPNWYLKVPAKKGYIYGRGDGSTSAEALIGALAEFMAKVHSEMESRDSMVKNTGAPDTFSTTASSALLDNKIGNIHVNSHVSSFFNEVGSGTDAGIIDHFSVIEKMIFDDPSGKLILENYFEETVRAGDSELKILFQITSDGPGISNVITHLRELGVTIRHKTTIDHCYLLLGIQKNRLEQIIKAANE